MPLSYISNNRIWHRQNGNSSDTLLPNNRKLLYQHPYCVRQIPRTKLVVPCHRWQIAYNHPNDSYNPDLSDKGSLIANTMEKPAQIHRQKKVSWLAFLNHLRKKKKFEQKQNAFPSPKAKRKCR